MQLTDSGIRAFVVSFLHFFTISSLQRLPHMISSGNFTLRLTLLLGDKGK